MVKYYAVRCGRTTGIFLNWDECKQSVNGYKGAIYKSFASKQEAESFVRGETQNTARDEPQTPVPKKPSLRSLIRNERIRLEVSEPELGNYIFCDGGHNRTTGDCAFGSVVNYQGRDLIEGYTNELTDMELRNVMLPKGPRFVIVTHFNDVRTQQNNGAELLALVAALRIALTRDDIKIIYCDSDLLLLHWSRRLNPERRIIMDPRKVEYIDELISLRRRFERRGGSLEKISGGNNLADLGYHK